ncbi:unnamed protein product [Spirodela intermedia]|uniref:NB-ARC domain-containing protein n=1 Tax=Spirodela intermedia TaxID=51605 RepID=A0A7I8L889_SPIIN|nr:unnamed protein product [Spirodela intermedia]
MDQISTYFLEVGGYLNDDNIGIIGIYGMAGVCKITLLQNINNKFPQIGAGGFDVVIWIIVAKDSRVSTIQELIGNRLGLSLSGEAKYPRFLLLLDDVWEKFDLSHLGIPPPAAGNKCKIILTTRSRESFVMEKVGSEVELQSPPINALVKIVVKKCGGLPLALITVDRSMAYARSVEEWEDALHNLLETPQQVRGMEDEVLSLLKFSFDRLGDENVKNCLLYCSLYPEDYEINVKYVVRARKRGHAVLTTLFSACMLETTPVISTEHGVGITLSKYRVTMHDVVREMCLWLTGGEFDKSNTYLSCAGYRDIVPRCELRRDARRISLMDNAGRIQLSKIPPCPNLQTLLWKSPFMPPFKLMPGLRVLDLSGSRVQSLPDVIGLLSELRCLNSLKLPVRRLPSLSGLRILGLYGVTQDIFGFYKVGYFDSKEEVMRYSSSMLSMADMEHSLTELEEIRLIISTLESLELLLRHRRPCRCTTKLEIDVRSSLITAEHLSQVLSKIENLFKIRVCVGGRWDKELQLHHRQLLDRMTMTISLHHSRNLRVLSLSGCDGLRDLTCIRKLACLEKIILSDCRGMGILIGEEERGHEVSSDFDFPLLLQLKTITLWEFPALKIISSQPMLLPSLQVFEVYRYPLLEKIPFGSGSSKKIAIIKGEREWWDGLNWGEDEEGQSIKHQFSHVFHETRPY